jgi:hypothetical protein
MVKDTAQMYFSKACYQTSLLNSIKLEGSDREGMFFKNGGLGAALHAGVKPLNPKNTLSSQSLPIRDLFLECVRRVGL